MIQNYVIVEDISEVLLDKNNKKYKVLTFVTPEEMRCSDTRERRVVKYKAPKTRTKVLAWECSYLDGYPDFGFYIDKGNELLGDIVTMEVEPYVIEGRSKEFTSFTTVVFGDSSKSTWNHLVHKTFKKKGRTIKDVVPVNI